MTRKAALLSRGPIGGFAMQAGDEVRATRKILAVTDLSERAQWAERRAVLLATALKCEVFELMMVKNQALPRVLASIGGCDLETAKKALTKIAKRKMEDRWDYSDGDEPPALSRSVRFGDFVTQTVARADEGVFELTVVGGREPKLFLGLPVDGNAEKLLRVMKRPLLIVRNEVRDGYGKVLVGIDFSDESMLAARLALEVAPVAQVAFLHAFQSSDEGLMRETGVAEHVIQMHRAAAADKARQRLERFIAQLGPRARLTTCAVHHGFPARVIRDYALKMRPDLIALGKRSTSRLEEMFIGSVVRRTVESTSSDILLTP